MKCNQIHTGTFVWKIYSSPRASQIYLIINPEYRQLPQFSMRMHINMYTWKDYTQVDGAARTLVVFFPIPRPNFNGSI